MELDYHLFWAQPKDRTGTAGVRSRSKPDLSIERVSSLLRTNTGQQSKERKWYVCVNMSEGKHTPINKCPFLLSKAEGCHCRWPMIKRILTTGNPVFTDRPAVLFRSGHLIEQLSIKIQWDSELKPHGPWVIMEVNTVFVLRQKYFFYWKMFWRPIETKQSM